jgi:hypothetical protein
VVALDVPEVSGSEVAFVVSVPDVDDPEVAFVVPDTVDEPEVVFVVPDVGVPEVTFVVPDVDEPDCVVSVALCAALSGAQALSEGTISAIRSANRATLPCSKQSDNRGIRGCWTPPHRRTRSSSSRRRCVISQQKDLRPSRSTFCILDHLERGPPGGAAHSYSTARV